MEPQALFWLAVKGVAVAAVPLAYVALSRDPAKYRKLAWVTAFLTLDLIMFGAFTRLTDSGLGCPDWPGCYGHSNPLTAGESIRAAESAQPTGPVTMTKAWIEMLHRYFAMGVGLLIIILTVQAWRRVRTSAAAPSPWLATATLVWVCLQGAFGALTVTQKLQPLIVTVHLLGGIGLLALLVWLALRESPRLPVAPVAHRLRPLAVAALCVTVLQIALGGWVSTNYAVLACSDFPHCQGAWVPPLDFEHAFTLVARPRQDRRRRDHSVSGPGHDPLGASCLCARGGGDAWRPRLERLAGGRTRPHRTLAAGSAGPAAGDRAVQRDTQLAPGGGGIAQRRGSAVGGLAGRGQFQGGRRP